MCRMTRLMLVLSITSGCGAVQVPADEPQGVRPSWGDTLAWTVDDLPAVQIGLWNESSETFEQVRIAKLLTPSRIAVVDRMIVGVRVFDLSGDLTHTIGRGGEGPGEFRLISGVWSQHDTVFVTDNGLARVNFFDLDGEHLGQTPVPRELGPRNRVVAAFSNGDLLLEMPDVGARAVTKEGPLPADSIRWSRASRDFDSVRLLATGVYREVYGHPWDGGFALGEVTFTPRAHATVLGDDLILARGTAAFEVEILGRDAGALEQFGLPTEPTPTTQEARERYVAWRLDNAPSNADLTAWERVLAEAPMSEVFPATGDVLTDPLGNAWVEYYSVPWGRESWAVFDRGRVWMGNVEMPQATRLFDVGRDEIIAVHQSELGVETVVVHNLRKP